MTPREPEPSRAEARRPSRERRRSTRCPSPRPVSTASWPRARASRATPRRSFTISETALTCETRAGGSNTIEESGNAGALSLVRQDGACDQDIPVTIEIGDHQIDITKPFVSGSAFRMTIDWVVETPHNPVPATKVDYLDGFGPHDMQFCLADGPDDNSYPDLPPRQGWSRRRVLVHHQPDGDVVRDRAQRRQAAAQRGLLRGGRPPAHPLDANDPDRAEASSRASALRRPPS